MADEVKRRGRPPKSSEGRKGGAFTFRCRPRIRARLNTEAAGNARSVSEEIERRLESSFDAEMLEAMLRRVVREEIGSLGLTQETDFARYFRHQEELRHARALRDIGGDALAVMADAQH